MNIPTRIQGAESAIVEIQRQLEQIQGRLQGLMKALPELGVVGLTVQPKAELARLAS